MELQEEVKEVKEALTVKKSRKTVRTSLELLLEENKKLNQCLVMHEGNSAFAKALVGELEHREWEKSKRISTLEIEQIISRACFMALAILFAYAWAVK